MGKVRVLALLLLLAVAAAAHAFPTWKLLGELNPNAISALALEDRAELNRALLAAVPPEELAALLGFDARSFRWEQRTGGYRRTTSPAMVVHVEGERARVLTLARAWLYVYGQEMVPLLGAAGAQVGFRLSFSLPLTPAAEQEMFVRLVAAIGEEAGYTRTGESEILVLNFEGPDERFAAGMRAFEWAMAATNPVVAADRFGTDCETPSHDWQQDPTGAALLGAIGDAGTAAKLRHWRARYESAVRDWLGAHALK